MDNRYFAVKAAAKRTSELNLHPMWKLRFEVKFLQLQTELLKQALSPVPVITSSFYDHLTLLVEEMAAARDINFSRDNLAEHLEAMLGALKGTREINVWENL